MGMLTAWRRITVDDVALTENVKRHGSRVYFVPASIVRSYPSMYSHIMEFTTRQFTIVRWYWPKAFAFASFLFALSRASIILGLVTLYLYAVGGSPLFALEAFLLLWTVVWGLLRASMDFRCFQKLLNEKIGSRLAWVVADFLAQWLIAYNLLRAWRKTAIKWCGLEYDLKENAELMRRFRRL